MESTLSLPGTRQKTLARAVACEGIGVHAGRTARMTLNPAEPDTGIVFVRTDLVNGARVIPARWDHVVDTRLCTVLGNGHGGLVATVEHLMAALHAAGVDNARVELDGPEVPVMDGSAEAFSTLIDEVGLVDQTTPRRVLRVLKTVRVGEGTRVAELVPSPTPLWTLEIAFPKTPVIGTQRLESLALTPALFRHEVGRARTFGFWEEVDQLRQKGLALGGSLDNAIVIKDGAVMNEGGLRYKDEFVRHKLLDAVGDMALAGATVLGHFRGNGSGHALNNQLLRTLFSDPAAWRLEQAEGR